MHVCKRNLCIYMYLHFSIYYLCVYVCMYVCEYIKYLSIYEKIYTDTHIHNHEFLLIHLIPNTTGIMSGFSLFLFRPSFSKNKNPVLISYNVIICLIIVNEVVSDFPAHSLVRNILTARLLHLCTTFCL